MELSFRKDSLVVQEMNATRSDPVGAGRERGEMHYGVQDRMSASSRDEKEEKHVLKYVGDPVFGFKPSKTRIEVCKALCRDVRMEASRVSQCCDSVRIFTCWKDSFV